MFESIAGVLPALKNLRREIHQHPEVALEEFETALRIKNYLKNHTRAHIDFVTPTGIIAIFDSGTAGKTIMLRADIDALPIQEINDFEYRSEIPGKSHKCGHDGHTVIMLGVASMLTKYPIKNGKVILLFQPAEENGKGAEAVLENPLFNNLEIDFVFALHNLPGFPKHQIVIRENNFNANVKSLIIKLNGKTAHAAEPEKGHNPALAIADIIYYCDKITNNIPASEDFFLITPIHMHMGELAYGVSAGQGELHLTIRSWGVKILDEKCSDLVEYINTVCEKYNLQRDLEWTQIFFANMNDNRAIEVIRSAANNNKSDIHEMAHPFRWGEDFGLFTQKYKGAMFGLGAGENTPALHNPDYDFPDDITGAGIQLFYQILKEVLD